MTDQPPPPPGNYPPPPPPPGRLPAAASARGGYPPPPGGGYPPPPPRWEATRRRPGAPAADIAERVVHAVVDPRVAYIIDYIPYAIIVGIGYGIETATQETAASPIRPRYNLGEFCATGDSTLGVAAFLCRASWSALHTWSGTSATARAPPGSSIGKSIMKFKVVSEKTWQPIGFGMSVVRELCT